MLNNDFNLNLLEKDYIEKGFCILEKVFTDNEPRNSIIISEGMLIKILRQ